MVRECRARGMAGGKGGGGVTFLIVSYIVVKPNVEILNLRAQNSFRLSVPCGWLSDGAVLFLKLQPPFARGSTSTSSESLFVRNVPPVLSTSCVPQGDDATFVHHLVSSKD